MNLPLSAKSVFEGNRYTVYRWKQKLYDESITTFEGVKRKPSVQILAFNNGSLLLLKEEQPGKGIYTSLPGGVIEKSERPKKAASREFQEETGLNPLDLQRCFKVNKTCIDWETTYFITTKVEEMKKIKEDPGERISCFYADKNQFIQEIKKGNLRNKFVENEALRFFGFYKSRLEEKSLKAFYRYLMEKYS